MPPLQTSSAGVGWAIEAPCLLRRRPPSLGTSVCTSSTPTPSKAESADRRRRRKRPTRTSRAGEGLDRVHYVPARPRPLGEHGGEPHGLRFTRTFRTSRIAAVVHGREATLKNCTAHHRIFSRVWDRFLRPLGPTSNIWPRGINYFTSRSRDIHTSAVTARLARKG